MKYHPKYTPKNTGYIPQKKTIDLRKTEVKAWEKDNRAAIKAARERMKPNERTSLMQELGH